MKRMTALLSALLVIVAACGSTEDESRNVAIPSAGDLAALLPEGVRFAPGTTGAVAVAAGQSRMCAIDHVGDLWCWGETPSGLYSGAILARSTSPVKIEIPGAGSVTAVATHSAGRSICAVKAGAVWCWGENTSQRIIPTSSASYISTPTLVTGIVGTAVDVVVNFQSSCALLSSGAVWCWGDSRDGSLGIAVLTSAERPFRTPLRIDRVENVTKLTGGGGAYCALKADESVLCWGQNKNGLLGNGTLTMNYIPNPIAITGAVRDIAMSSGHACAALSDGTVHCWGQNVYRRLGFETSLIAPDPTRVPSWSGTAQQVAVSDVTSCVVDETGQVWCWGWAPGSSSSSTTARSLAGLTDAMGIAPNSTRTLCAVTWDAEVKCLGADTDGALGDGDGNTSAANTAVKAGTFGVLSDESLPSTSVANPVTTDAPTGATVTTVSQADVTTTVPQVVTVPPVDTVSPTTPEATGDQSTPTTLGSSSASEVTVPQASSPAQLRRVLILKQGKRLSGRTAARFAKVSVPKGAKISLSVPKASSKVCAKKGANIAAVRPGKCSVTVKVTPKGKKTRTRIVVMQVVR